MIHNQSRRFVWVLSCWCISAGALADEVRRPVTERFAEAGTDEIPDFRQHVVPLLGRMGCNGRACHGSFQGRGGFRLSLFGHDFAADHEALTAGDEPRINREQPGASLILQKPTATVDHEGGERMKVDQWEFRLLKRWIESGAVGDERAEVELEAIDVEPREILFQQAGQTANLRAVARWSDGSREDVTPLCRFRTNDEAVATIDEQGLVKGAGTGDTHVVVFYDNGVVPVPVLSPVSAAVGPNFPNVATPTTIDELVVAKLRKLGIVPSELCGDGEFLRRVSLDMTGTLPLPEEVLAFLADPSPDKRARKIDELLALPTYVAWWTTRLCDWTGNNEQANGEGNFRRQQAEQWYEWIRSRVSQNVPYDQIIEGIVLAVSRRPEEKYEDFAAKMTGYVKQQDATEFAGEPTMPHFWSRRLVNQPKDKALSFSYAFLGVRLQCAECHKHPFDQWTKQDFEQFTAFFRQVSYGFAPDARERAKEMEAALDLKKGNKKKLPELIAAGKIVPWREVFLARAPTKKENRKGQENKRDRKQPAGRVITPKLLGGEEVLAEEYGDPRRALMEWLRREDNPYFARALVNRVWAGYFNVGIVEPPDDMNLANPPSNEPLLDYLTREFVAHGYDMKWLHRQIANSRTYQASWRPNETNRLDNRNFSHAVVRRLPAEVAYDALVQVTAADHLLAAARDNLRERAIGISSSYTGLKRGGSYVLSIFGKPARATNCDCERSNEPSLLQTVFLRNDQITLGLFDRADGWVKQLAPPPPLVAGNLEKLRAQVVKLEAQQTALQVDGNEKQVEQTAKRLDKLKRRLEAETLAQAKRDGELPSAVAKPATVSSIDGPGSSGPNELVRQAYLRALSRLPNAHEAEVAARYLAESVSTEIGMRDILWALVNTKEFIVNR